ncbi:MAG TPA: hypothetical protein VMU07_00650 [Candidatus Paceibacterota bacterium]|nr:hypothetical protein [Candidatus Paceibacterota bacterium]
MPTATTTPATSTVQAVASATINQTKIVGQALLNAYFSNLTWLEILGLLITAVFVYFIVKIAIETNYYGIRIDRFKHLVLKTDLNKQLAQETWERIQNHFYKGSENDMKVAILEADKILNEALRAAGMPGTQLGDRLKRARTSQIPNLDELWQAHKLRNQIAHEPDFKLKRDLAERALGIYEVALRNLGALD